MNLPEVLSGLESIPISVEDFDGDSKNFDKRPFLFCPNKQFQQRIANK